MSELDFGRLCAMLLELGGSDAIHGTFPQQEATS